MNFPDCIAPVSVQTFFDNYWGERHLILSHQDPNFYGNIFSLTDMDSYLQIARTDPQPATILAANRKSQASRDKLIGPSGAVETPLVMRAYSKGETIVLNFMQRFWRPLTDLCRNWELLFRHPVAVHAYLSPPDSQAYEPHFDAYENFVLQLHGSKTWKIYPPRLAFPIPAQAYAVRGNEIGTPLQEISLNAGDLLYLPRGMIHEVTTCNEPSLHLSVSVRPYRIMDWIIASVEEEALRNSLLRKPLPVGFLLNDDLSQFHKELENALSQVNWQCGVRALEKRFLSQQEILPEGRFASFMEVKNISPNSRVSKYPGTLCAIEKDLESATLFFPGNFLRGPLQIHPALEFISRHDEFLVRDLPGDLSDEAKVVLVRRLINEGMLKILSNQQ